ncbi:MAG: manganese efflux pump, partial [Deltaproteobacteria bacterium]|nr:manganese efflux pump [Deltaproteobacteria bacterium]
MFTILFIAFGLAMDAFAVSISSGFTIKNLKVENALKVAVSFGLFQAVMPVIGWLAGLGMKEYIAAFDHWAAFALLGAIGIKMIYESGKMKKENAENPLG